jgi:hypothetical protein
MADPDEVKPRDAPLGGGLGKLALLPITLCEQVFADVVGAVRAQGLEVG